VPALLTLELASAINDHQHAIARRGALRARSQVARDFPVKGFLSGRNACCDRVVLKNAVGARALAKDQADGDAVGGVIFGIPGHCEIFALGDRLRIRLAMGCQALGDIDSRPWWMG
jgi:hypothetical protein